MSTSSSGRRRGGTVSSAATRPRHPFTERLARSAATHPWRVLGLWAVLIALAFVAAGTMTSWSGPWGVSFTANLTPHETGLGKWTQRNFIDAIRTGRHMGRGRPILPPMPIPMYKNFVDADLEAIFAYLRQIPPVENRVPEPLPPAGVVARK